MKEPVRNVFCLSGRVTRRRHKAQGVRTDKKNHVLRIKLDWKLSVRKVRRSAGHVEGGHECVEKFNSNQSMQLLL